MIKKRVAIGMSGGVDSSVAAALLCQQGFEVIGITMRLGQYDFLDQREDSYRALKSIEDARKVAKLLGIRHYVLDLEEVFAKKVLNKFIREYSRAKTPNPCVDCNKFIKFDALYENASRLGAEYLATGHYARIIFDKDFKKHFITFPKDLVKDQTYFLCAVNKRVLKNIIFPLGGFCKNEVRKIALKLGLKVADKPSSQDICFLSSGSYDKLILSKAPKAVRKGYFVDNTGKKLIMHKGTAFYTVGQRAGIAGVKEALYCLKIDFNNSNIVVGPKIEAYSKGFISDKTNFFCSWPKNDSLELMVKIRYNQLPAFAIVKRIGLNKLETHFKIKQFAVTPGQAAAFYDKKGLLLAGSAIKESF